MSKTGLTYCGQITREQDPDRFLLSLMAPARSREALWTLFAFNYEIARVREIVTEPMLGRIRLQWWREALEKIYQHQHVQGHQVVDALNDIIQKYNLPQHEFNALIDAREFDLENQPHATMESFLSYIDQTSMPLSNLCALIIGAKDRAETIAKISRNYALIGCVRAAPFLEAQSRRIIPHGVSMNKIESHFVTAKASSRFFKAMQALADLYRRQALKAPNSHEMQAILFKEINVLISSFI